MRKFVHLSKVRNLSLECKFFFYLAGHSLPMKKFFKKFIRSVWFKPGSVRKVLIGPYRGLKFRLSPHMNKRMMVFYKRYEKDVMSMLEAWLKPGQTVMVVGAHIGIHALYIAKKVGPSGQVHAFEAWKENYEALKKNQEANQFSNLYPHNLAVSSEEGTIQMAAGSTDGRHHVSGSGNDTIEVECVSLDHFSQTHQLKPDLLLIDVEGHDLEVLKGASLLIQRRKPVIIVEHHGHEFPGADQEIIEFLKKNLYTVIDFRLRHLGTAE